MILNMLYELVPKHFLSFFDALMISFSQIKSEANCYTLIFGCSALLCSSFSCGIASSVTFNSLSFISGNKSFT